MSIPFPKGSPSCLLPLREAFQDQQMGLTQDPHITLSELGLSVGFVCKILNEVSGSHSPCFPILKPHWSPIQASGSSSFCFRTSRLGSLMLASHPLLLGGNPSNCGYPSVCGCLPRWVGLDYTASPPLPSLLIVVPSLCL